MDSVAVEFAKGLRGVQYLLVVLELQFVMQLPLRRV